MEFPRAPARGPAPGSGTRLAAVLDGLVDRPVVRTTADAARHLGGLLMPSLCALCAAPDGAVCPDCAPELAAELLHPFRAERDAAALPLLIPPPPGVPHPVPVVAAAHYGSLVAEALLAFKDHGRTSVARILRPAVYRALAAAPGLLGVAGPLTVVPVPGSATGFRRRGFDPVEELLAGPLPAGWTRLPGGLAHRWVSPWSSGRARTSHAGSGARQRRTGGRGRFRPTRRLARTAATNQPHGPGAVVVFDDVMTTGATLAATWRALEQAGITPVGAVVLAAVTAPGAGSAEGLNSG